MKRMRDYDFWRGSTDMGIIIASPEGPATPFPILFSQRAITSSFQGAGTQLLRTIQTSL